MKKNINIKNESIDIKDYSVKKLFRFRECRQLEKLNDQLNNSLQNKEQELFICAWCEKLSSRPFTIYNDNGDLIVLCSEICFNQYRRDSFKKNKKTSLLEFSSRIQSSRSPTLLETNKYSRRLSTDSSFLPPSKRHRSSPTRTLPTNFTQSPFMHFSSLPMNPNYYPHPTTNIIPSLRTFLSQSPLIESSNPCSIITKESSLDYTSIYPRIIPLCIPINLLYLTNAINRLS